jgi:ferrochelatase
MGVTASPTAVLLMAYGSPENLDDMEAYLLDIRGGRPTSPQLVAEIRERYALIGGRSPLFDITCAQATALEAELNRSTSADFRAFVGMRHWKPRLDQAVEQIGAQGFRQIIGLVMAPHQSRMSTGAYFRQLDQAIADRNLDIEVIRIGAWHDLPGLIDALAEQARVALTQFERQPYVLFTAHSLPVRILAEGDPYDAQLHQTAALVAARLSIPDDRWQFCYQSAGQSQEPWLGPPIEEVIPSLAQAGETGILAVPVGFVCDHVEILYDLDILARRIAAQHGARFERSASLNTSPTFISALADLVRTHAHPLPGA